MTTETADAGAVNPRFEMRRDKWGIYYHDKERDYDLSADIVLAILNEWGRRTEAAAKEREACAAVADDFGSFIIAQRIRARGETT